MQAAFSKKTWRWSGGYPRRLYGSDRVQKPDALKAWLDKHAQVLEPQDIQGIQSAIAKTPKVSLDIQAQSQPLFVEQNEAIAVDSTTEIENMPPNPQDTQVSPLSHVQQIASGPTKLSPPPRLSQHIAATACSIQTTEDLEQDDATTRQQARTASYNLSCAFHFGRIDHMTAQVELYKRSAYWILYFTSTPEVVVTIDWIKISAQGNGVCRI